MARQGPAQAREDPSLDCGGRCGWAGTHASGAGPAGWGSASGAGTPPRGRGRRAGAQPPAAQLFRAPWGRCGALVRDSSPAPEVLTAGREAGRRGCKQHTCGGRNEVRVPGECGPGGGAGSLARGPGGVAARDCSFGAREPGLGGLGPAAPVGPSPCSLRQAERGAAAPWTGTERRAWAGGAGTLREGPAELWEGSGNQPGRKSWFPEPAARDVGAARGFGALGVCAAPPAAATPLKAVPPQGRRLRPFPLRRVPAPYRLGLALATARASSSSTPHPRCPHSIWSSRSDCFPTVTQTSC